MAVSLAEKLEQSFQSTVDLVKGSNGIFEVQKGDKLVYSKKITGEFPDEEKLIGELKSAHSMG